MVLFILEEATKRQRQAIDISTSFCKSYLILNEKSTLTHRECMSVLSIYLSTSRLSSTRDSF